MTPSTPRVPCKSMKTLPTVISSYLTYLYSFTSLATRSGCLIQNSWLEGRHKDPLGWREQVISETVGRLSSRLPCGFLMVKARRKKLAPPREGWGRGREPGCDRTRESVVEGISITGGSKRGSSDGNNEPSGPCDLSGTCFGDKFVVSRTGEAYHARERGLNPIPFT